jgi:hypothetical protein
VKLQTKNNNPNIIQWYLEAIVETTSRDGEINADVAM